MRSRAPAALTAVAVLLALAGACTDSAPVATTGASSIMSGAATTTDAPTTTSPPPTTSTAPTTGPSSDTTGGVPAPRGLGDSRLPELGNSGYDVTHYTLELSFDPAAGRLAGIATIEATAETRLATLSLDFFGMRTLDVTVDDQPAEFDHVGHKLVLVPSATIGAGEAFTVSVEYAGTPRPVTSATIGFQVGWRSAPTGEQYVVAEPDGAHTWFPCNDHPLDKAAYTFRVTVPTPLLAAANGEHVDTVTDVGAATWVYDMPQPMATYLATVVLGELQVVDDPESTSAGGIPIRNLLPPDVAAAPPAALGLQGEMMAFLVERFGPFPFDLYGIAVVPGFPAALENQTLSIFGSGLMAAPFLDFVLVHELAHQWFGDHLSPGDWGDIWLNEGFATYAEWLWLEDRQGAEALEDVVRGTREAMVLSGLPPPGDPPADDLFNAAVYQWGALTLHALRTEIGDEAFLGTLRTYLDRFGGGTARTDDFIATAEEVAGEELDELFEAWLHGDTVPEL